MPDSIVHSADCQEILGKPFTEVHDWLDEFAIVDGVFYNKHRKYRHHLEGLEEVRKLFGGEAYIAGEIHILRDMDGIAKDRDDYENGNWLEWKYFEEDKYNL